MSVSDYTRLLKRSKRSFFLFGARGVGKSTWLMQYFEESQIINLLRHETFLELSRNPGLLEAKVGKKPAGSWVCIDEVQKIPSILDEVHRLIEGKKWNFALSGSSARKLKRGGANLLAGRAITQKMEALCYQELGDDFKLDLSLQWGTLPLVLKYPDDRINTLNAYVHTYIKEEIREEGIVRNVEPFVRFLEIVGQMNGQQLNTENIARESQCPRTTVDTYLSILEDTLLIHRLPAYRPQAKVREQSSPKLYWFDQGVARGAAGLLNDPVDATWLGTSLETLIYHELRTYNDTQNKNRTISYYRTGSGSEIDFIIETKKRTSTSKPQIICIEVKLSKKWKSEWEKPIRSLAANPKLKVEKMIGLYTGTERLHFDGFDVIPVLGFLRDLYDGQVF